MTGLRLPVEALLSRSGQGHDSNQTRARLAVDIGGTFTDVVLDTGGTLNSVKVPTTPEAPEKGFMEGLRLVLRQGALAPERLGTIIHGTTLATNALIERKGAKTALITTGGFRDSLEIGYEARFDQYDLMLEKPAPLVPRKLRFGVLERMRAVEVIEDFEAAIGKPVITSNQALMYVALKRLNLELEDLRLPGRLFAGLAKAA